MHIFEEVLVGLESCGEEFETVLKELVVVVTVKNWVIDVADQVLEEAAYHNVNDLADLQINLRGKCCLGMVLLELLTASYVFFGRLQVELVKCFVRILFVVDMRPEVKAHVVHQKSKHS